MTVETTESPNTIIEFWYSDRVRPLWFNSTPDFDAELKEKFEPLIKQASAGALDSWRESSEGCLALVLLLDQFPLNIYRNEPQSFATEKEAIEITKFGLSKQFDRELGDEYKAFFYLPLMHSESLEDQNLCVELMAASGLKDNLRFAEHHRNIIQRYGRFPHRNRILGRASTTDEIEYLNSEDAFTG